jgi:type II secretory pathway component PulF
MQQFTYTALDSSGRPRNGTLNADDRRTAARKLAAQGLRLLTLSNAENSAAPGQSPDADSASDLPPLDANSPPPRRLSQHRFFGPHNTARDFVDNFHQLHSNGLPMGDAVKLLAQRVNDPALRYLCQSLWRNMSEGATLAGAMSRFPAVFDPATLHLIEAGESTGNLVAVVKKVLQSYEMRETLRGKILSSIGYPACVCSMAIGVLCIFVFILIPRIQEIMTSLNGKFPVIVQILIGFSDFLVKGGPFIFGFLLLALLLFLRWRKTPSGRYTSDNWFLKLPLIGKVLYYSETTRMTELLATLMSSGINATDALRLSERPISNTVLQKRLGEGRQMINDGAAFASAFKRHALLPRQDLDILTVGENTGSLADTFQNIARRHITALDASINRLIRVITIVVLAGTVSLVFTSVLSVISPIISVSQSIKRR